jgi:hypothetical protein
MCALFADKAITSPGLISSQNGSLSVTHGYAGLLLALVPKSPIQTFNFESGTQGFNMYPGTATVVQSTDWSRSGSYSMKITTNGSTADPLLIQSFFVIPQTTYYMSAWCYSPLGWSGGTNGVNFGFDCYSFNGTGDYYIGGMTTPPLPFAAGQASSIAPIKFTMPIGCTSVHAYVRWNGTPSVSDILYVDDIMFGPWPSNSTTAGHNLSF